MKDKKQENKDDKKVEELTGLLQRVQADFENYKKTVERQRKDSAFYAKQDIIEKLLPILDSIELALKNNKDKEKFMKGVELIFSQFHTVLRSEGLRPIDSLGKKLDCYKHEVLMREDSDKEEDTVLEELQKGYMLDEKVIRHAKVKVAKNVNKKDASEKSS